MTVTRDVVIRVAVQRQDTGGVAGGTERAAATTSQFATAAEAASRATAELSQRTEQLTGQVRENSTASSIQVRRYGEATENILRLGRGLAFLTASSQDNLRVTLQLVATAQGAIDTFKGLEGAIISLSGAFPVLARAIPGVQILAAVSAGFVLLSSAMRAFQQQSEELDKSRAIRDELITDGELQKLRIMLDLRTRSAESIRDEITSRTEVVQLMQRQGEKEVFVMMQRRAIIDLMQAEIDATQRLTVAANEQLQADIARTHELGKALDLAMREADQRDQLAAAIGRMSKLDRREADRLMDLALSGRASALQLERLERLMPAMSNVVDKAFAATADRAFLDRALAAKGLDSSANIDRAVSDAQRALGATPGQTPEEAVAKAAEKLKSETKMFLDVSTAAMTRMQADLAEHRKKIIDLETNARLEKQNSL